MKITHNLKQISHNRTLLTSKGISFKIAIQNRTPETPGNVENPVKNRHMSTLFLVRIPKHSKQDVKMRKNFTFIKKQNIPSKSLW